MKRLLLIYIATFSTVLCSAQEAIIGANVHYGYQFPMGNFQEVYTNNSNIGLNFNIKLVNNITIGLEGQFLFGSNYKDLSLLGNMVTNGGFIIVADNQVEIPAVEGRGGNFFIEVGKIFSLDSKTNSNNGLHIKGGLGYLFYSAYVNADLKALTQLSGGYADGYNKLENGLSVNTFIGYTLYSQNKLINGSAGIQAIYTSTKYAGTIDFSTGNETDKTSRGSLLIGPKINITLILKRFKKRDIKSDEYFYD